MVRLPPPACPGPFVCVSDGCWRRASLPATGTQVSPPWGEAV